MTKAVCLSKKLCVAVMLQELSIKYVLINNGIGMVSSQPHTHRLPRFRLWGLEI